MESVLSHWHDSVSSQNAVTKKTPSALLRKRFLKNKFEQEKRKVKHRLKTRKKEKEKEKRIKESEIQKRKPKLSKWKVFCLIGTTAYDSVSSQNALTKKTPSALLRKRFLRNRFEKEKRRVKHNLKTKKGKGKKNKGKWNSKKKTKTFQMESVLSHWHDSVSSQNAVTKKTPSALLRKRFLKNRSEKEKRKAKQNFKTRKKKEKKKG